MPHMRPIAPLALVALACITPASAAQVAVLMPGSAGIVPGDFLVRNEARFKAAGLRTVLTTSPSEAAAAVASAASQGQKAVLVGMSKGSVDVASALASGAKPAGAVFVSGIHDRVIATLGSPDRLPRTLVVHHSRDVCKFTLPSGAQQFVAWSHGKARVRWINTDGEPSDNPCNARAAHGFFRKDGPAVAAIIAFVKTR